MRVKEFRGEVVFMHEVVEGAAEKSWGVHVARLAGVPEPVAKRAEMLLKSAEKATLATAPLPLFANLAPPAPVEAEPEPGPDEALAAALAELDPDAMSPRQALEALYTLRAEALKTRPGQAEN
jgi:DNA mismatch repair protein MutS